ncbi:MAG TPA: hypothetical protein VGM24_03810 [Puia sp.]|jgi:hypothetical protein
MKKIFKTTFIAALVLLTAASCKKSTAKKSSGTSAIEGFWTYKEDPALDYWNDNVLFKSDGTFRMYTALSLADTSAAQALADTASQVVTFGTYTVNGNDVEMVWEELSVVGFTFSGTLNGSKNNIIGNIETKEPDSASPLWYLTKP